MFYLESASPEPKEFSIIMKIGFKFAKIEYFQNLQESVQNISIPFKYGSLKSHVLPGLTTGIFIDEATGHFIPFVPSVPSVQYKRAPGVPSPRCKRAKNGGTHENLHVSSYNMVEFALQTGPPVQYCGCSYSICISI